ncbi:hypothetical protein [Martelella mangrovi]|uniref:Uncharacterized protein n=1 Tax=Martelella mangrovi TaxID=1397477 RepID=A0ABV2IGN3_9HYPH
MSNRTDELSQDQRDRIEATLKRIRAGLRRFEADQPKEPASLFSPEIFDEL